jgi:hypothetical protein
MLFDLEAISPLSDFEIETQLVLGAELIPAPGHTVQAPDAAKFATTFRLDTDADTTAF